MDKLSKTDTLTGLYNHKTFHDFIESVIEQCNTHDLSLQLALIDIDDFKLVNDTYGHMAGDEVLKKVSALIQSFVTPNDFVARYGGEEFAVIFTGKDINASFEILENIRCTIENTKFKQLNGKSVTISIGLQEHIKDESKDALFNSTDNSLYIAKRKGKNMIFYDM